MIKLEISGENTADFAAQLTAVAQLMAGVSPSTAAPAATTTGRGKGKSSTAPAEPAATTTDAAASGASDQSDTSGPVTRDSVSAKCALYGNPQKGGLAALKELFIEMGSPNGKWSEITDDKLVALNARLDDLLA